MVVTWLVYEGTGVVGTCFGFSPSTSTMSHCHMTTEYGEPYALPHSRT